MDPSDSSEGGAKIEGKSRPDSHETGISTDDHERLARWRASKDYLSIGNLGEHITGRLLVDLDYQLLACQNDLLGMVPEVLGITTKANPEDFIAVDPLGRLVTVNSKASIAFRACVILKTGNLSAPRLGKGQEKVSYSTLRASLTTPLDGESFSQVVKVDLTHLQAQIFEVHDSGRLSALGSPHNVARHVLEVMQEFPDNMPPPQVWDLT